MTYARIENDAVVEYPVDEGTIKQRLPGTSFPIPFKPPSGYVEVAFTPAPQVDHTKNLTAGPPVKDQDAWAQSWIVEDATQEQIAERTASRADAVRTDRNQRLADCDWTQLPDAPVDPQVWATYRQELRDVTAQVGFPWEINWPEQP